MWKYLIYKATNIINTKVYIGYTSLGLEKRKRSHKLETNNPKFHNTFFKNALRKYGIDGFIWEELFYCPSKEIVLEMEKIFIKDYKANNKGYGYNSSAGGEGPSGFPCHTTPHSEKTKEILRQKTLAHFKKIGHGARLGKKHSLETKKKMSIAGLGRIPVNKGIKISENKRNELVLNSKLGKKIIAIDLNTGLPRYFTSIKNASKELQINRKVIQARINNIYSRFSFRSRYEFILES